MTGLEDAVEATKPRKRGRGFSLGKAFMVFLFIIGLLIGVYLQHYFIEPVINKEIRGDAAECEAKLDVQDKQINDYISCLQENGIEPSECT